MTKNKRQANGDSSLMRVLRFLCFVFLMGLLSWACGNPRLLLYYEDGGAAGPEFSIGSKGDRLAPIPSPTAEGRF